MRVNVELIGGAKDGLVFNLDEYDRAFVNGLIVIPVQTVAGPVLSQVSYTNLDGLHYKRTGRVNLDGHHTFSLDQVS